MILGIPHKTISSLTGIKNIPKDMLLEVPIKGTLDEIVIYTKKTSRQFSLLQAAKESGTPDYAILDENYRSIDSIKKDLPPVKKLPWEQ